MASSEPFQCSICLEVFREPVSTPCGHNYCRGCIQGYWALGRRRRCPLCTACFEGNPELEVNTEFRDLLEVFKKTTESAADVGVPARPGEVPCDLCEGTKVKAVKSCLVCLASYCPAHLQPHTAAPALKWHKLVEPLRRLEQRVCTEHNRLKELFCRRDRSSVCAVCAKDEHEAHGVSSVEEEVQARRTQLKEMKKQTQQNLREKSALVEQIQNQARLGRVELQATGDKIHLCFATLMACIEEREAKLVALLEEKQKAAERRAEVLLLELYEDLQTNADMEGLVDLLIQSQDEFQLLQDLPSVPAPSTSKPLPPQPPVSRHLETVRSAVGGVRETFNRAMDDIMRKVGVADGEESVGENDVFDDELGKIQQGFSARVTLDPDTAHPSLAVSEDGTEVTDRNSRSSVPDTPSRFDSLHYVLAKEGFASGRSYFQVSLGGKQNWEVGLARESVARKGAVLSLSPEGGCWTLGSYWGVCQANQNPPVVLPLRQAPQKVGVLVDYEGKSISFYDVERRLLIHSFVHCAFTPAESVSEWSGRVFTRRFMTPRKTKIYPIFQPGAPQGAEAPVPLRVASVRVKKADRDPHDL